MRQTKLMLAFLAILALAATSCAKLQARDNLNKGSALSEMRTTRTPCRFSRKPSNSIRI